MTMSVLAVSAPDRVTVVGIDMSLTATGCATISDHELGLVTRVSTVTSAGRRGDNPAQRARRLRQLADDVLDPLGRPDLVVVEGPSIMSKGGSNWDRAGLWWLVVDALIAADIPVAIAAPTVVKKFAAGKGNADKAAVAANMTRLWPDVEPLNDNEFDALALATMGAAHLGIAVPTRAHHADALLKVEWPHGGAR
jgi:crossover junction endodeoxyribonuclease RuvC